MPVYSIVLDYKGSTKRGVQSEHGLYATPAIMVNFRLQKFLNKPRTPSNNNSLNNV